MSLIRNKLFGFLAFLIAFNGFAAPQDLLDQDKSVVNILLNPGFENGLARWTASGGTLAKETTNPGHGTASASWDASGSSQTLKSTAVTIPKALYGNSCYAAIHYRADTITTNDYSFIVQDGSNADISAEVLLAQTTKWTFASVSFTCPTSGSLKLTVTSKVANPAAILLDQLHVGSQNSEVLGAISATPTTKGQVTSYFGVIASAVKTVSSANYSVLTTDGYATVLVTTGASDRTIDLPAAASNAGRRLEIVKVDSGAGFVLIDANASETIDSELVQYIMAQFDKWILVCDGTAWYAIQSAPEYAHNSSTATTGNDTTSFAYGPDGKTFSNVTAYGIRRVRFKTTIQKSDNIVLQIKASGGNWVQLLGNNDNGLHSLAFQNGADYGVNVAATAVNSTDMNVQIGSYGYSNGAYGAAGQPWSNFNTMSWRVKKYRN